MRHTTTGCEKPWQVAKGYIHESKQYAQWAKEQGEPSLLVGVATFLGGILAIVLVVQGVSMWKAHNLCGVDGPLSVECR